MATAVVPAGCNSVSDSDCSPSCGNGVAEPPETCDTAIPAGDPGACPTSCDDGVACTMDSLVGSGCSTECSNSPVSACVDGDGCCPGGCDSLTDSDCSPSCGNGVVEPPELCDTAIALGSPGACPISCSDGLVCTRDSLVGSGCSAECSNTDISECADGDGCCPSACDGLTDSDCPLCGNGVIEVGETCDGDCPTSCDDSEACTIDTLVGDPTMCNAECTYEDITVCQNDDGCCPSSCDNSNDNDCPLILSCLPPGTRLSYYRLIEPGWPAGRDHEPLDTCTVTCPSEYSSIYARPVPAPSIPPGHFWINRPRGFAGTLSGTCREGNYYRPGPHYTATRITEVARSCEFECRP